MNYKKIKDKDFCLMGSESLNTVMNGMTEKQKENYILIYNFYRSLFTEYMIQMLNLKQYDKELADSKLDFKKVNEEEMDVFQYFSSDELNYLFIRNNLHIEKLEESELLFLKQKLNDDKIELDEETTEFIKNNFSKVIFEDVLENGERCLIPFGPNSREFFSENDSIVIGIRYDRYSTEGKNNNKWVEQDNKQRAFFYSMIDRMEEELADKLDVPISIIEYDKYSIITIIQDEKNDGKEER